MKKYIGILILMLLFSYQCVYAAEENLLNGQQQSTLIEEEDTESNDSDFIQNSNIMYEDYFVQLEDLYKYNIISLQNADINCHIRGSIWVGNTLTGSQYVDDGSLDGTAASNSYVFNNQSNIYFKSRTNEQSLTSYKGIFDSSVNNAIQYWTTILESFPNNENFIYVNPDENGFVDLKKWDYQSQGSDELQQTIPKVYWTNATSVEMGGLAGHLIAPFADIHIVSCNHRGSILGWNIYTDGESHINYWTPDIKGGVTPTPVPTETPTPVPTETPTPVPTETPTPTETPPITPMAPTPTQVPKPTPPDIPDNPKPPKTGDEQDVIPLILLLIISLETILIFFLPKAKNKKI